VPDPTVEREETVLRSLVKAVEKYGAAERAHRSPMAEEGSGQDLWAAESNLSQALHEAKQVLAALSNPQGGQDG
jgi:hypothetical protein